MTRGFVTLTTGDIKYYKMAANMLRSFKIHNPEEKFAIICDRKNQYTDKFDDVILLEKAYGDYRDKFALLVNTPYNETIFIEPDCLIYRDLSFFWELLSGESDFSCFGWNKGGIDCWFKTEEAKNRLYEIVSGISNPGAVPLFNPGYIFIRKSEKCSKMYNDCAEIADAIKNDDILSKYAPLWCKGKLRDDPIFSIAMFINGFVCNAKPEVGKCISLPSKYKINKIDIVKGRLDVTDKDGRVFENCALLHFSTRKAMEEGLYPWQCAIMSLSGYGKNIYKILDNVLFRKIFALYRCISTVVKKLKI